MINRKVLISAGLSLLVIIGAVAVLSSNVFAEDAKSNLSAKFRGAKAGFMGMKGTVDKTALQEKMKTQLAGFVSKGTLTHAEADKVLEYFANYCQPGKPGERITPLDQMVKDGVLTQEKADALASLFPAKQLIRKGDIPVKFDLASLVNAGTLTQAEADKVKEYLEKYRPVKGTAPGERVNPLEQMVKDGVLTQDKADALASLFPAKQIGVKGNSAFAKFDLSSLVDAGTLTQDEADKIKEYLEKYRPLRGVEQGERVNPIDQMVKDGVLTEEKADAVAKSFPAKGHGFMKKVKPSTESATSENI